ncbi:MAG: T9SS type A sorting domain-containing protein [Candidatus Eisenbacteria bacterium]|uniref:T9SS type A sorting domain-containing protein n=1 Tax=Eiseniibacteriota bacterium TaxID=2212470 RepID=A0A538T0G7_UNCEI|nr:MAG: T9SS type A sorting domain-containing protein [Candidatus Eisenbacteria bacterium]
MDTWELDLSGAPAWVPVPTSGSSPPGGYGMASVYEPVRDRMIIFGGSTSDAYLGAHNDVWALDLHPVTPNWHKLAPASTLPRGRRTMASIYDPLRDRVVLFGGYDATSDNLSSFLNDTWELSFRGSLQWTQLAPAGSVPVGRDAMSAAYDPVGDRMVVYGGWSGATMLGDTWFLNWGGQGQASSVTPSSSADPGTARVQWGVRNATGPYGAVYRSADGGPWTSIATVQSDASGDVTFEDKAVTSGHRYGYLLAVPSELGCDFTGQVFVDVPEVTAVNPSSAVAFALDGARPNPVVSRFTVSFALPSAAPARLDLLDIAGRLILSREVGSLGAGPHVVEMGRPRDVHAGLYLLRLAQAGRSLTKRLLISGAL